MEIPFDIVVHTFVVAKYKLALKIAQTCKYFRNHDAWKLKCNLEFPRRGYFEFWTPVENYFVCRSRSKFALAVNFEGGHVEPCIYEYHPMLTNVLDLSADTMADFGRCTHYFVKLNIKKRFVVIQSPNVDDPIIRGQFSTLKSARKRTKIKMIHEEGSDDYCSTINYVIVDLKYVVPWFLTGPPVRARKYKHPETFYKFY